MISQVLSIFEYSQYTKICQAGDTESDISGSLNFFNLKIPQDFELDDMFCSFKIPPIRACGTFTMVFPLQLKGIQNG